MQYKVLMGQTQVCGDASGVVVAETPLSTKYIWFPLKSHILFASIPRFMVVVVVASWMWRTRSLVSRSPFRSVLFWAVSFTRKASGLPFRVKSRKSMARPRLLVVCVVTSETWRTKSEVSPSPFKSVPWPTSLTREASRFPSNCPGNHSSSELRRAY